MNEPIGVNVKLVVSKRAADRKSELSLIRHRGDIPAILYAEGKEGEKIVVNGAEFGAVLRKMKKGHLPTTVFTLDLEGKSVKAIVKDIQYEPTTYNVIHLDFCRLEEKVPVTVRVPLEFTGVADCEGIKLGGFLRPVVRHVKVRCLPKDLPKEFPLDIRKVQIGQSRRVKHLAMPAGVQSLMGEETVVMVVAKR